MKNTLHLRWRLALLVVVALLTAGSARAELLFRLHAWDGKSAPSKDPLFEEVVTGKTYILRNQKCYPGMEFGVLMFPDDDKREWFAGISDRVVPGVPTLLMRRDDQHQSVNFRIDEEGTYDFILNIDDLNGSYYTNQAVLGSMLVRNSDPAGDGRLSLDNLTLKDQSLNDQSWKLVQNAPGAHSFLYNGNFGRLKGNLKNAGGDVLQAVDLSRSSLIIVGNDNKVLQLNLGDKYSGYLNYVINYRESGSNGDFQKLELDNDETLMDISSYYGVFVASVTLPANTEFYLQAYFDGNGNSDTGVPEEVGDRAKLDILPLTAEPGRTVGSRREWAVAPRSFGAPEEVVYFKTGETEFHGLLKFNPYTMDVRLEHPTENAWYIHLDDSSELPKLYMHGIVPLEGNSFNDWGVYHQELSATAELDSKTNKNTYKFKLNLTDDAYFRIFTEEKALNGGWRVLGLNGSEFKDRMRACWSPAADVNVDVPVLREVPTPSALAQSWNQGSPADGTFWHIPAGKWILAVNLEGDALTNGPNKAQLYCYEDTEDGEEYILRAYNPSRTDDDAVTMKLDENGNYVGTLNFQSPVGNAFYDVSLRKLSIAGGSYTGVSLGVPYGQAITFNPKQPIKVEEGQNYYPRVNVSHKCTLRFTFNPTTGILTYEPDYSNVHMPLKPEDFLDSDGSPRPHYFFVGSRTADFRLMPEWELKPENDYSISDRLMYPGMFGIARVDSYDDYILHKFKLWYVHGNNGNGAIINASGTYTLGIDPDDNPTQAVKNYGDYLTHHNKNGNPWPYVVLNSMKGVNYTDNSRNNIASWWHFNAFEPDAEQGYTREILSRTFKKGTPSLASSIRITLDANGDLDKFIVGEVTTWTPEGKTAILKEVKFYMCGTDFINERPYGDTRYFDPQKSALFGYTKVNDWANQWIQYDPQTGQPYMDAEGKYLFQTVFQDSWIKDHPTLFYRKADNTYYDSNSIRLKSLAEIQAEDDDNDKFRDYYVDMMNRRLGDGENKKYTAADAPIKYDFFDQVGKPDPHVGMAYSKGDYTNELQVPTGDLDCERGWQPYALADVTFGGIFKVWSGFSGGHEGYGSWIDNMEIGDAYAWFNLNVGHSMARNPLRAKPGETEVNASTRSWEKDAEDDRLVNFYLTGKDEPAADFMTLRLEEDGSFPIRTYKRVILWLNTADRTDLADNTTSGMSKSFVQLVVSDLSPVIRASKGDTPETDHDVSYAWNLEEENVFEDKVIREATVTVYRDGQVIGTYPQPDAVGKKASECTTVGMFGSTLEDCLAGEYWMRIDITYTDGVMKDALSNHVHVYDPVYPAVLAAWQRLGTAEDDGRTLYGFNVSGNVSLPEEAENIAIKEYEKDGATQRLLLKDIIDRYVLSYTEYGAEQEEMSLEYKAGETSDFDIILNGADRVGISVKVVAKESPLVIDGVSVDLDDDDRAMLQKILASGGVELTLPTATVDATIPQVEHEAYDSSIDIEDHPGHTAAAPVRYRTVNNMKSTVTIMDNALLEDISGVQETADYDLTASNGRLQMNGVSGVVDHMSPEGDDYLISGKNTFNLKTVYRRGDKTLGENAADPIDRENYLYLTEPEYVYIEEEDVALRGTIVKKNGIDVMAGEIRIYVPESINYLDYLDEDVYFLGGFGVPQDLSSHPVPMVKASEDMKGGFLLIDDKHADKFLGLEGSTIGGSFLEWNGTQTWCQNHDWAHAVAREAFALSFADAVFFTDPKKKDYYITPGFTVPTYNVFPFVVETAAAAAPARDAAPAAASAGYLRLLQTEGSIIVPEVNYSKQFFTGIGEAYGPVENPVDVYSITGQQIMRGVSRSEALRTLRPGLYLIGDEKIVIK